ncbi:TIGR01777 family oxidoreductase [Mucilaginibacter sp. RS28]|uniref:TIGR01777 family oxidoreductase n=1 Tax=Mucilaginibacter straminoryzae TaxID=2932774 RepID=A0A9X1X3A2_9SPHI|nr:TIGR01777 family oxidoreductase [Mucilaginibacter straminoryzae]MCJ8210367.1 TIGR01777 family oxidoreductase [Mucilaginibacter straminoryzae]
MPHVLITGASGLIGRKLSALLLSKNYKVSYLSRSNSRNDASTFLWDVDKGTIDERCLDGVDLIVHLAGAGVAEKRWTKKRKKEIIDSRVKSIELIYDLMHKRPHQVKRIISASATGYYSSHGDMMLTEEMAPARNFLGRCCHLWEQAVDKGHELGLSITKFRTGVVLSTEGGALPVMARPVKLGFGAPLGNGKQWVPWIHEQDVVDLYFYAIENTDLQGVYNMVAPNPVNNKQLTKAIAKQLHRPLWLPNVPAAVLKLLLGEMSLVVLGSTRVSAAKIEQTGFRFKYVNIEDALKDLYE